MSTIYRDANGDDWMRGGEYVRRIVHREVGWAVVKVPGHKVWGGIAMGRDYVRAEFAVYEEISPSLWAKRFSFPVRS